MNVAIVDYGAGISPRCKPPSSRSAPGRASLRILSKSRKPNESSFPASATSRRLNDSNLPASMRPSALRSTAGTPLLGICLGMQWLFDGSEEATGLPGLAAFPGTSRRFPITIKTPHVGWNQLQHCAPASRLLQGIPEGSYAYFTHSYRIERAERTIATSDYAGYFCAAIERGNLFGVQFHPEKSSTVGITILKNFCDLPC